MMASFSRQLARVVRRLDGLHLETARPTDDNDVEQFRDLVQSSIEGIATRASELESDVSYLKTRVEQMAGSRQAAPGAVFGGRQPALNPRQSQGGEASESGQATPLGALNATELSVLNLLDREGELSGPRIREAMGRTREHTARLLKKLYDAGFIDRSVGQMPYRYKIRKELTDLLGSGQKKMDLAP